MSLRAPHFGAKQSLYAMRLLRRENTLLATTYIQACRCERLLRSSLLISEVLQ